MQILLAVSLLLVLSPANASTQKNQFLTGSQIREAESRLAQLGFWTGQVNGKIDPATRSAIIAFQKWQGRQVTGQLSTKEFEALQNAIIPRAKEQGYGHVEVDLDRQVLLIIDDAGSTKILPVSTGNDKPFIEDGQRSIAYTPRGRFVVYDKSIGWEKGYLGSMYYSNYISGGVAIHGHPSVPAFPASHGCIRIPMFAAREVSKLLRLGTIVLVYDKVSFVSGKEWANNPELKQAAMAKSAHWDYDYFRVTPKTVVRKPRPKITRADE
jgi:N-acetylmuramoyl-L-alanine amidase